MVDGEAIPPRPDQTWLAGASAEERLAALAQPRRGADGEHPAIELRDALPCDPASGLTVDAALWAALLDHAMLAAPEECCGIGTGAAGTVSTFHPLSNVASTPVVRYEIAPADQLRVHLAAAGRDHDVTLVFHSHPATEPVPSVTDRTLAGEPGAVYAILSLADPAAPLLRAWRIADDAATEIPVTVLS